MFDCVEIIWGEGVLFFVFVLLGMLVLVLVLLCLLCLLFFFVFIICCSSYDISSDSEFVLYMMDWKLVSSNDDWVFFLDVTADITCVLLDSISTTRWIESIVLGRLCCIYRANTFPLCLFCTGFPIRP